ncbi:hypothetical protein FJY71_01685 [candidate division WOR-3 bacterium]|nr:hypothetical protein [candidate division WOR-3 bacterium]
MAMRIGTGYSATDTVALMPDSSVVVSFAVWNAEPVGTHAVVCSTALPGDVHPENDTALALTFVRPEVDASPTFILRPAGAVDSGTIVTPLVQVLNRSSHPQDIPVLLAIGAGYADTVTISLAAGQSDTVRFREWVAGPPGAIPVRCSTALVGDLHPANDTLSSTVVVSRTIDAAAVAILLPGDSVEYGAVLTPEAAVANLGTSRARIPVVLTIGSGYADTAQADVAPAETVVVAFASWTALEAGLLAIRCTTALPADTNSANDFVDDSVLVFLRTDAAAVAVLTPSGRVDSGTVVTPVCLVANNSSSQRLVPVRLDIGNGYSDTTFKSLGPHQTDTVAFIDWLASPLGAHAVRCSTMLEGDEVPENDTCGTVVEVAAVIDAAAVSILAPTGTVDSGSVIVPQALVANRGTRPAFVPVHLAVETGYEDSTAVLLAPDSSAVVSFQAWTAGAVGTFRVRCSTGLVGDSTPENDTISTSVTVANRHDVACCLVLSPTGTVDSGSVVTPRALVANRGNLTEDVPVVCRVAPAYCDTSLVTVQPGESVEVLFADWVAGPVGWLNVRCSTALGSDTTTGNDLAVDSVLVVSHPDAAVTDIYAPLGRVDSGSVITPLARVCNYGTSPAVVPVRMRIGAGYDEMRYKYLGVGAKDTVEFPAWASSPLGWVVISCSTALAGDERPANDRRQDSVMVVATVDVGVDAVLAPTGAVDSGTSVIPAAVVSNYGTSGALVPVRLRIAPDYDSVIMTDVAPGSSDTIFFPFWLASPVDLWPVRCSTELSGDHNNCNDRQVAEVRVGVRRDVACVTINAPPVATESGTVIIPEAVIANHGTSPAEIPLFVRIGSDYLRSRRKLLSPGGRDTVQFPAWSAHPRGDVAVACSVALAGDEVPKNNAIHQSVYVHHQLDGAVCAILVPLGPVDSGHQVVPKARVANHGIGTLGIPVEMRIGGFYRSVRTKILAPGTEDSIHFDVWSADQVGLHAVRCTSSLDGDCNPANDCRDGWTDVAWRDAGCISILEPAEVSRAGDTVVPRARVRNFGSRAERIPAVFRAGPLYARLRYADSLPPGDSVDISYPELIIGQGTTIVSCSAALHGDMHAANNKLERAVYGTCRELLLEPDTAATAPPAGIVNYRLVCRNTGNAGDTVDVTSLGSRPGWNIELLDSAGLVPLGDHNANGVPDLGLVPSGSAVPLVARVTVPANELGLVTDSTSIQATSGADPRTWDRARVATTVTAVVDLMIEPDQFNFAPPGIPHTYAFDVTNLGNVEDFADLSLSTVKGDWLHELLDAGGKSLGDRNSNGRQDIGPVPPRGGTVELRLQVTPDRWARIGQQDTSGVTIQSFADESVRDQAFAVTEIDGSVSSLSVEPDQTSTVDVGGCRDLALWVETVGNIREVVNVAASGLREGWSLQLLDESAARELGDTDGDGQPDLGYVWPAARTPFTARVTAPTCAGLVGSCDSLSARLVLTATLAGNRDLRDSATIVIQARPRFEAHNVANPFSDRTRFFLSTPGRGRMSLLVYTRLGELVRRLLDGSVCGPGVCAVDWDGTNDGGRRLAPGVYFYLFEFLADAGPDQRVLKKAVLKR